MPPHKVPFARLRRFLQGNFAAVLVFVCLITGWELACTIGKVPQWLLPAPSRIVGALWTARDILPIHIMTTTIEVLLGFGLGVSVGVPLSILIVLSPLARKVIYPILVVLQSVPKVALAPIVLVWIGYGTGSKVLIAAMTAFFPIIINTSAGMEAVPRELLELSRSLNSPSLKVFWKVRLPFAMPYLFSGMKVAMALALIGAVVGEFVGSDRGLGYLILTFSSTMNTPLVFGAMALLAVLGICLFYVVSLAERVFCPWYQSGGDKERYI
ncbi:ABC transporter permease [Xanthobacter sp. KR7-65]|uniref:ABC transporter permease n=1 Tax=Xanthobacter sp. KR7-65 TaxID=3156612 RepID=UPI0032B5EF6B